MTYAAKHLKLSIALILGAAMLFVMLLSGNPRTAQAAEVSCPTFRVLHNDRIGALNLPKGNYNVTILDGDKLSCAASSKLFAEFLQDYNGVLRKPWVVNVSAKSFTRGKGSKVGFRVSKTSGGSTGGGGSTPASCPGYFRVLHNDSIGSFQVPAGQYRITLIDSSKFTCAKAVKRFREFLLDFDGKLPGAWRLSKASATFYKPKNPSVGFNINKAYGPSPNPNNNKKAVRCPGTFRVLHNDRIGALSLPAGPYYINVGKNRGLSCNAASDYFRDFLNRTDGKLPSPWRLNVGKARFTMGAGGPYFRVQKAS
ncbi:MAG: hypothetical protein WBW62_01375 [Solirubrobacterales bacterium]